MTNPFSDEAIDAVIDGKSDAVKHIAGQLHEAADIAKKLAMVSRIASHNQPRLAVLSIMLALVEVSYATRIDKAEPDAIYIDDMINGMRAIAELMLKAKDEALKEGKPII